jgi:hypothetical protein
MYGRLCASSCCEAAQRPANPARKARSRNPVQRYAPTNPLPSVASEDRREVEAFKTAALQVMAEGFLSVMIVEEFQRQTAPERLSPHPTPVAHIANAKRSLTEA